MMMIDWRWWLNDDKDIYDDDNELWRRNNVRNVDAHFFFSKVSNLKYLETPTRLLIVTLID